MDNVYIAKSGVYEITQNSMKNRDNLYVVVSDNKFQQITNSVLLCTIRSRERDDKESPYRVPIRCSVGDSILNMTVCVDKLFTIPTSRIFKYRFTLTDEVIEKVERSLKELLFGRELFTLNEAIVKLYYQDKSENESLKETYEETSEVIEIDDYNMSIEDKQQYYALNIAKNYTEVPEEETVSKPKRSNKSSIDNIHNNYEDFLLDYYFMNRSEFLKKWGCQQKDLKNRIQECKRIYISNGGDPDIWKELKNGK